MRKAIQSFTRPRKSRETNVSTRVAINGLGRIGRMMVRALHESGRRDIEIIAINDLNSAEANAHFLRYDTVHGRFRGQIVVGPNSTIDIGRGEISVLREKDPRNLPWKDLAIDVVIEATGLF